MQNKIQIVTMINRYGETLTINGPGNNVYWAETSHGNGFTIRGMMAEYSLLTPDNTYKTQLLQSQNCKYLLK